MKPTLCAPVSSRRGFIVRVAALSGAAGAVVGTSSAFAQDAMLSEADPQAKGLGYAADASKVDAVKHPRYAAGQACGNCAYFKGSSPDAAGGCALFPGKQVAGKGWCSAHTKKAG
jgi:High potential iron-sulfur protein